VLLQHILQQQILVFLPLFSGYNIPTQLCSVLIINKPPMAYELLAKLTLEWDAFEGGWLKYTGSTVSCPEC
jgi:hypothetical protein